MVIELEKTYLAKELPIGLENNEFKEVLDIYVPKDAEHPVVRIRKNGDKYELTKKEPVDGKDSSEQYEQTIHLTKQEFTALQQIEGKKLRKIRYYYDFHGITAEIDVFKDALEGLVLVDFEFTKKEEKDNFNMPDFCLAEVTQELFLAGGMLCGKSYDDIREDLARYNYKKLSISQY